MQKHQADQIVLGGLYTIVFGRSNAWFVLVKPKHRCPIVGKASLIPPLPGGEGYILLTSILPHLEVSEKHGAVHFSAGVIVRYSMGAVGPGGTTG